MADFFQTIFFHNYLLMLPVVSFVVAQVLKVIIYRVQHGKFDLERVIGAGGMPSSHAALVCSMTVGAAREFSMSSPIFAICFVLAVIVMFDAMGVRLETGKQAQILNLIMAEFEEIAQNRHDHKPLKELVGHTPFQVLSGAILGIAIGLILPVF